MAVELPDPRFEESLLQYAARCGIDRRDKDALGRIRVHWDAELTRRYAGWVARSGRYRVRDESVPSCGEPGCCPSPDWME